MKAYTLVLTVLSLGPMSFLEAVSLEDALYKQIYPTGRIPTSLNALKESDRLLEELLRIYKGNKKIEAFLRKEYNKIGHILSDAE